MKRNIVYILGLFEDQDNPLFQYIKKNISFDIECCHVAAFSKDKFGTQSFFQIVQRVQSFIDTVKPEIIVAHSLGAYVAIHISTNQPLLLLEPSLAIADIMSNTTQYDGVSFYDDGEHQIKLSHEFLESIKTTSSIEKIASSAKTQDVHIFGAGKGGYKIAERYHQHMPHSQYIILPDATHEFGDDNSRQQILAVIEKRLEVKSSREEGDRTKSW